MPQNLLAVSHRWQWTETDCLPICSQMVLDYLNISCSYSQLMSLLDTKPYGTPFRNIQNLSQLGVTVTIDHLGLAEISSHIRIGLPVIACIYTSDLSYWSQASDHVMVVIGVDQTQVYVNDPSLREGQYPIPQVEFELAQLNYDNLCAVIFR